MSLWFRPRVSVFRARLDVILSLSLDPAYLFGLVIKKPASHTILLIKGFACLQFHSREWTVNENE